MTDFSTHMKKIAIPLLGLMLATGFATLTGGSLSGCGGKSVSEADPAALYKDAEEDISSDRYQLAIDKLRMVRNKFPYSKYAVDAQLRIADVYYMQELYPEAASNYETFRDLHPKHEKVAYAMFRIGKSYFKDIPGTIARDLTPAQKALDAYNEFLRRFPTAPESAEAHKDVADCRKVLAEKELYIGNFYYKRDFYESAKPRYEKILELYSDTPSSSEAQYKLTKSNEKIAEEKAKGSQDKK